jgi:hypothetical protein
LQKTPDLPLRFNQGLLFVHDVFRHLLTLRPLRLCG